jgi:hypothetical protein
MNVHNDEISKAHLDLSNVPDKLKTELETFEANYKIEALIVHPSKEPELSPPEDRICRFCKRRMPEVNFASIAHTIPQFMGNKNLISNFECDTCNGIFSKYETELSKFLGVSRTLSLVKGKKGVPTFTTQDGKLAFKFDSKQWKLEIISDDDFDNIHFEIDEAKKLLTINSIKHPYIPLVAFKALLKMGLCYIDTEDVPTFDKYNKFLGSNVHDQAVQGQHWFRLFIHAYAGISAPYPVIFKCKRIVEHKDPVPAYTFIIYFGNYILQFFIAEPELDHVLFTRFGKINFPPCPPFLPSEYYLTHPIPQRGIFDLSSFERVVNEKQQIIMSFDEVFYPKENEQK